MTTPGSDSRTGFQPLSEDDGGLHVIIATFEDGHTERYRCPCATCDLWRSVDFQAMRNDYERRLDERIFHGHDQ